MTLTFQFTPEMKRMWPALSDDRSGAEWVKTPTGGFYVLHLNFPDHAAAVEMPGAEPGILAPYQERAKTYPPQFVLHFDPAHDANKLFPLLMATADTIADANTAHSPTSWHRSTIRSIAIRGNRNILQEVCVAST